MPITSYLVHWRKVVIRRLTSATLISSICVFLFQRYVFQSHHMPMRMLMAMNPSKANNLALQLFVEAEGGQQQPYKQKG